MLTEELASVLIEIASDLRSRTIGPDDTSRVLLERLGGITSPTLIPDLLEVSATAAVLASTAYTHDQLELVLIGIKVAAPPTEGTHS